MMDLFKLLSVLAAFWRHPFTAEHPLPRHWCTHISPNLLKKQTQMLIFGWTVSLIVGFCGCCAGIFRFVLSSSKGVFVVQSISWGWCSVLKLLRDRQMKISPQCAPGYYLTASPALHYTTNPLKLYELNPWGVFFIWCWHGDVLCSLLLCQIL